MTPNPDNNPDKVSGFTRHRAAVESRQTLRHLGGIAEGCDPAFRHPAIYPAKMAGSLPGQLPGHFVRLAEHEPWIATSSRHGIAIAEGLGGKIRNPDTNPDKLSGFHENR